MSSDPYFSEKPTQRQDEDEEEEFDVTELALDRDGE
jgi:hypothetical protein